MVQDLGGELPLLPLRGILVFPGFSTPLHVGRPASVAAVEAAWAAGRRLLLAAQRDPRLEEPGPDDVHEIGVLAELRDVVREDEALQVTVTGVARARIRVTAWPGAGAPCHRAAWEPVPEAAERTPEVEALERHVRELLDEYARRVKRGTGWLAELAAADAGRLCDAVAVHLLSRLEDRQAVLAAVDLRARLELVAGLLTRELEVLELEKRIQNRVRRQMERAQREYYLREQLRAIQKELGERDDRAAEVEELRQRLAERALPDEVRERVAREIDRLEKMPPLAAEAVVVRHYIDWLLALPWLEETEDNLDLAQAERVLNEDHYGLEKVKERILEFLAIRKLAPDVRGPILCLVGPPGVGKTSLGRSIARALGRRFVRLSLGGVRDEAEIRGHRRTYVGALPGRIIQGLRQAGTRNPVFLLDEIDKLGLDFRGDPAAALLEVLDPEQNARFSDHYIELPFDLSRVLFIATANGTVGIPRPLLDRMETIFLSGYTDQEKFYIARDYLIPRQLREHGLRRDQLRVSPNALRRLIAGYTREAGVRQLERQIAALCRKAARRIAAGEVRSIRVTASNLERLLGRPHFSRLPAEGDDQVGVATALAWTETGGEIMPVEVITLPGGGALQLTGRLGEVMRESAQAAFTYVRARVGDLGVDPDFHRQLDVHIHVPEGAVPKDGPSAGIALATALASALSGRPVRHDVAMTGEITLRGRVLPVGGVKEKVMAAYRAGIRTVILPAGNAKDLEDVPAEVRRRLRFLFVEHMDEVLRHALRPATSQEPLGMPALVEAAAGAEEAVRPPATA